VKNVKLWVRQGITLKQIQKTFSLSLFEDPFEQWNRVHALTDVERIYLQDQLAQLKACRGTKQCTVGNAASSTTQTHTGSNTASSLTLDNTASITSTSSRYKKRKYQSPSKFAIERLTMSSIYGEVWFWYCPWCPRFFVCIMRFQVLKLVTLEIIVFWDVMLYSFVGGYQCLPECWYLSTKLHDVPSQKIVIVGMCACVHASERTHTFHELKIQQSK
jgi:hypothetical protein